MHLPERYKAKDFSLIRKVIEQHPLATIIHNNQINFLPFVLENEGDEFKLVGHCAKENSLWRDLEKNPELRLVFHGPNRYISPFYYKNSQHVPTWNYVAVEVTGKAKINLQDAANENLLKSAVKSFEAYNNTSWDYQVSASLSQKIMGLIVGIEITDLNFQAKFKLGQNRSADDYEKLRSSMDGHPIQSYMAEKL